MQNIIILFWIVDLSRACVTPTFDNLTVQNYFNVHQFLGTWYEIKWYKNETTTYNEIWNDFVQVFQLEDNFHDQIRANGYARLSNSTECFSFDPWLITMINNSAKMFVQKTNLTNSNIVNWPYYILKTDYNHYALIYGCMSTNYLISNPCFEPMLWLFSRTIHLSIEDLIGLEQYIKNILCMDLSLLQTSLHSTKSCYIPTSFARKNDFSKRHVLFFINLLILYFILTYE